MRLTVNDFFCGAGGVGLGFLGAGYEVLWACDFDKYAVATYRSNVSSNVVQADIKRLSRADIPQADVWAFCFPCQDLSSAGKRKGFRFLCLDCGEKWSYNSEKYKDRIKCPECGSKNYQAASRSGMFFEMMRLLDETAVETPEQLPKALFIENVKGVKPYIPILKDELNMRGYTTHIQLFNSKYWGVPQNRERYFIVGLLGSGQGFSFPEEQHDIVPKLPTILDKHVDEKYYIDDEKAQNVIIRALKDVDDRNWLEQKMHEFIKKYGYIPRVFCPYNCTDVSDLAPTVTASCGGATTIGALYIVEGGADLEKFVQHKDIEETQVLSSKFRIRKLTPTECGRLQAFPMKKWHQVVSDTQAYKQFGNACTVNVVIAIAESVKRYLREHTIC